jgi:hypothetical protein
MSVGGRQDLGVEIFLVGCGIIPVSTVTRSVHHCKNLFDNPVKGYGAAFLKVFRAQSRS